MDFHQTDERQMLRESARRFLSEQSPLDRVRAVAESEAGYDADLWRGISAQGWPAMHIPEEYGGAGYTFRDTAVVLEEMGRALAPVPFLSSAVMATGAIVAGGTDEQKKEWLPALAAGDAIGTLAIAEPDGGWDEPSIVTTAAAAGDGHRITGTKSYVVAGQIADLLLVAAKEDGASGLYLVQGSEVEADKLVTLDSTRSQAAVVLDGARAVRLGDGGWDVVERVYDLARAAIACEQVGGMAAVLEMAVEYAQERRQFGRAIGSFQAIKHKCADMLIELESARSAAAYAAWTVDEDPDELTEAAPMAKAFCSEAYFRAAADNIQIHGGIGFTWEHDAHLYFKRAKSTALLFGTPSRDRAILADRLGL